MLPLRIRDTRNAIKGMQQNIEELRHWIDEKGILRDDPVESTTGKIEALLVAQSNSISHPWRSHNFADFEI